MKVTPTGRTLPEVTHHRVEVNGTKLHYVAAGTSGSPILLVHGFPSRDLVDFPKAYPAARGEPPRLRR